VNRTLAIPHGALVPAIGTPEFEVTAVRMAEEYQRATAAMRSAMVTIHRESQGLVDLFDDGSSWNRFEVGFDYDGSRWWLRGGSADLDKLFDRMKRRAWQFLTTRLGIRDLMSLKKRAEFDRQLESGEVPDVTPEAIVGILLGLADQARDFATEAAKEVFELLKPTRSEYKTNSPFRVGKRVILSWQVEPKYPRGFRPSYSREQQLVAIDNVFHVMDGRSILREGRPPLVQAIHDSTTGVGETDCIRFRCFKNRNLHLEFKRLDLVKQLNGLAAGEFVLGATEGE
jgi:hypothetical protein